MVDQSGGTLQLLSTLSLSQEKRRHVGGRKGGMDGREGEMERGGDRRWMRGKGRIWGERKKDGERGRDGQKEGRKLRIGRKGPGGMGEDRGEREEEIEDWEKGARRNGGRSGRKGGSWSKEPSPGWSPCNKAVVKVTAKNPQSEVPCCSPTNSSWDNPWIVRTKQYGMPPRACARQRPQNGGKDLSR